jgi:hypothetical protein
MSRRGGERPPGDYDVGYGKPPKHTQFKPGNPGRRKGAGNQPVEISIPKLLQNAARRKIRVKRGDQTVVMKLAELLEHRITQLVTNGSARDLMHILAMYERYAKEEISDDLHRLEVVLHQAAGSTVPLPTADLFEEPEE